MTTRYPLHQSPLYCLRSRKRLARDVIGVPLARLEAVANGRDNYRPAIRYTGSKQRSVNVPRPPLRDIQGRLGNLLNRIELAPYMHSGCRGRSYVSNALAHAGAIRVAKLDLQQFFPSITRDRIWHFFVHTMKCSGDVSALLAKLCTYQGSVPIGSRVSQVLAFHVARPMLDELQRAAASKGIAFTCYVDDLSFSGVGATQSFLAAAKAIVRTHGFKPHGDACYGPGDERRITGVLMDAAGLRVPPKNLEQIELSRLAWMGAADNAESLRSLSRLMGQLAAASAIDPRFRSQLRLLQPSFLG
jgi:RNA-directed DNA polymerase